MSSKWHQKKARQAEFAFEKALQNTEDSAVDASQLVNDAAMGGGDDQIYEKKLSKEEKKALAKAKREAKRKAKKGGKDDEPLNASALHGLRDHLGASLTPSRLQFRELLARLPDAYAGYHCLYPLELCF